MLKIFFAENFQLKSSRKVIFLLKWKVRNALKKKKRNNVSKTTYYKLMHLISFVLCRKKKYMIYDKRDC